MPSLSWLSPDARRLLLTRALRNFGYGYLAVVLALYLEGLGFRPVQVGLVLTATLAGSVLLTTFWAVQADRFGRRRTVALMSLVMAAAGLAFALGSRLELLLLAALTGTLSPTSAEVGPFLAVEQAVLPRTVPTERRTWVFSIYNMLGNFAGALGALLASATGLLRGLGLEGADAFRPLFAVYALLALANLLLFSRLSDDVELARVEGRRRFLGLHRSRGAVARLSVLFGLDAFAGGFIVHSLVAYWFHIRWGLSVEWLGVVFFWVGVLSGLSLLAASWLASRIGLVNTMVFTHLPSNILLLFVPLAPTAWLAVALFLARMSISQMDVPTRQSYLMAIVDEDERTPAAGITTVARGLSSAISPSLAGLFLGAAALGAPFFIAGGLKSLYDVLLYLGFRRVRPPEETLARVQP